MADISYTRTTWADGSEGGTPIDATKLNNIEQGIVDAVAAIGPNDTTEDGTLKAQIDTLSASVAQCVTTPDTSAALIFDEGDKYQFQIEIYSGTTCYHLVAFPDSLSLWRNENDTGWVRIWNIVATLG